LPEHGERFLKLKKLFLPVMIVWLVYAVARPAFPPGPKWTTRTTLALIVVDALFVRTANDPVHHYHRLGAGCVNKRRYFLDNSGIVADISAGGEPAPEIRDLGMLARHNADCELGG